MNVSSSRSRRECLSVTEQQNDKVPMPTSAKFEACNHVNKLHYIECISNNFKNDY